VQGEEGAEGFFGQLLEGSGDVFFGRLHREDAVGCD